MPTPAIRMSPYDIEAARLPPATIEASSAPLATPARTDGVRVRRAATGASATVAADGCRTRSAHRRLTPSGIGSASKPARGLAVAVTPATLATRAAVRWSSGDARGRRSREVVVHVLERASRPRPTTAASERP